jgi:hypothetical protein
VQPVVGAPTVPTFIDHPVVKAVGLRRGEVSAIDHARAPPHAAENALAIVAEIALVALLASTGTSPAEDRLPDGQEKTKKKRLAGGSAMRMKRRRVAESKTRTSATGLPPNVNHERTTMVKKHPGNGIVATVTVIENGPSFVMTERKSDVGHGMKIETETEIVIEIVTSTAGCLVAELRETTMNVLVGRTRAEAEIGIAAATATESGVTMPRMVGSGDRVKWKVRWSSQSTTPRIKKLGPSRSACPDH